LKIARKDLVVAEFSYPFYLIELQVLIIEMLANAAFRKELSVKNRAWERQNCEKLCRVPEKFLKVPFVYTQ